jgi:hypothetical protein
MTMLENIYDLKEISQADISIQLESDTHTIFYLSSWIGLRE